MSDNQQLLQQVLQRYGLAGANIQLIRSYNNDVYRNTNRSNTPRQDTPGLNIGCGFGSPHQAGYLAVFCDGSVHSIPYTIDPVVHENLGNREDQQPTPLGNL